MLGEGRGLHTTDAITGMVVHINVSNGSGVGLNSSFSGVFLAANGNSGALDFLTLKDVLPSGADAGCPKAGAACKGKASLLSCAFRVMNTFAKGKVRGFCLGTS